MRIGELNDISKTNLSTDLFTRKVIRRYIRFAKQILAQRKDPYKAIEHLHRGSDQLTKAYHYNASLKTSLHFLLPVPKLISMSISEIFDEIIQRYKVLEDFFEVSDTAIASFIAKKIKKKSHVFVYAHSHHVINGLLLALSLKKKCTVHLPEQKMTGYGKFIANICAKQGIRVEFYQDNAMHLGIQRADFVIMGASRIDYDGNVYNEVGCEMVGQLAHAFTKPLYVCADGLKHDTDARKTAETINGTQQDVWPSAPNYVHVTQVVEEKLHKDLVTGIICEFGILTPTEYAITVTTSYPEWFNH